MKTGKLLVGTLALVLVTGLIMPAYAQTPGLSSSPQDGPSVPHDDVIALDHDNMIFDGGAPNLANSLEMTVAVEADDFVLSGDLVLTDVHLWGCDRDPPSWDGTIEWWIFNDAAGSPGGIVDSGTGNLVDRTFTGNTVPIACPEFVMDFDLDHDVPLAGGTTYWLGLHLSTDFDDDMVFWELTDNTFGSNSMASIGGTFDNWFDPIGSSFAFFLTGHDPSPAVGGEFIGVDSTALLLTGAQMNAAWMIPVIVSGIGFAIVIARKF